MEINKELKIIYIENDMNAFLLKEKLNSISNLAKYKIVVENSIKEPANLKDVMYVTNVKYVIK